MSDKEALLATILAEPDNDLPRLVFADWLEENGTVFERGWAELIRVQIAKARLVENSTAWNTLDKKDRDLRKKHKSELLRPFRGKAMDGHVIRGFVERLTMHARRFMNDGERMFAVTPLETVRFVTLAGNNPREPSFLELCDSPPMAMLRGLNFEGSRPGRDGCETLAVHPHTKQVRSLSLGWTKLTDGDLAILFPPTGWSRLTSLNLNRNAFGPEGMRCLARANLLALESLSLLAALSTEDTITALACASVNLPALTHLELSGCFLTNRTVTVLAEAPFASRLRTLGLSTASGLEGRFGLPTGFPGVQRFDDIGLRALARPDRFTQLRSLNIADMAITEAGLRLLLEPGVFPHMETLDLRGISVSKEMRNELRRRYGAGVCRMSPA
jgi:uncharacterized protein (TIGR02996 family)